MHFKKSNSFINLPMHSLVHPSLYYFTFYFIYSWFYLFIPCRSHLVMFRAARASLAFSARTDQNVDAGDKLLFGRCMSDASRHFFSSFLYSFLFLFLFLFSFFFVLYSFVLVISFFPSFYFGYLFFIIISLSDFDFCLFLISSDSLFLLSLLFSSSFIYSFSSPLLFCPLVFSPLWLECTFYVFFFRKHAITSSSPLTLL